MLNDNKKLENTPQTAGKEPFHTFLINLVKPFNLERLKKSFSRLPKGLSIGETTAPISDSAALARAPKWLSLRNVLTQISDSQVGVNPYIQLLHQKAALNMPHVTIKESIEIDFLKTIGAHQQKLLNKNIRLTSLIDFKKADLKAVLETQHQLLEEILQAEKVKIKAAAQQITQPSATRREEVREAIRKENIERLKKIRKANIEREEKTRAEAWENAKLDANQKTIKGLFSNIYKKIFEN